MERRASTSFAIEVNVRSAVEPPMRSQPCRACCARRFEDSGIRTYVRSAGRTESAGSARFGAGKGDRPVQHWSRLVRVNPTAGCATAV